MGRTRKIDAPEFKDLDVRIGRKIYELRAMKGMSQENLGEVAGISFFQICKYESGTNSIAACRLCAIAEVLEVPVSYFFEDLKSDIERIIPRRTLQLAQKIESIPNFEHRDKLLELIRVMAVE